MKSKYNPSPTLISWPKLAIRTYQPHIYQITPLGSDAEFYWGNNSRGPVKGLKQVYSRGAINASLALAFCLHSHYSNFAPVRRYNSQRGLIERWYKDKYGWEVLGLFGKKVG